MYVCTIYNEPRGLFYTRFFFLHGFFLTRVEEEAEAEAEAETEAEAEAMVSTYGYVRTTSLVRVSLAKALLSLGVGLAALVPAGHWPRNR